MPKLNCNLLSVHKVNKDLKCVTHFTGDSCVFQGRVSGNMIGSAEVKAGLYLLKDSEISNRLMKKFNKSSNKEQIMLLHYQLGISCTFQNSFHHYS